MTPMSDVMVLLLTFFMLTSTFVKKEPVKVNTPGSVSEIKIPDRNILTILVEQNGKIYMTMDRKGDLMSTLESISERYGLTFSRQEIHEFGELSAFSVPIEQLSALLQLPADRREGYMSSEANKGIPCDSTDNQFKDWVQCAKEVNPSLKIAIKADAQTPYKVIKNIMNSLQDIKENRYNLFTSLRKVEPVD